MAKGKRPKQPSRSDSPHFKGTVLRSTGSWYRVRLTDGQIHECRLRGKMRTHGIRTTNPIAVGDHVLVGHDEETGYNIFEIEDRTNYVLRKSVNLSKRAHILCANIDQAVILFTIEHPVTTLGYVDRLLLTCEAYHIKPVILFNKIDLLSAEGLQRLDDYQQLYNAAGYEIHAISAKDKGYADEIREILQGKVSFLVGRSGAGKSATVNLVAPELKLKIGDVSDFSGRGKHTTTFAEMFELPFGGEIIDSPGFREMQLFDFEKAELAPLFPEMRNCLDDCRFSNCLHLNEPGCAVKLAVKEGKIPESRYHTYLGMLQEVEGNIWD
ncbi:MAG: ribosome small subunit-dependent GTPase A [Bacteroidetes bacterium]|nr:ribosome small subunit-dependent GTPase A [Bacteroidota bacterium]MBL0015230.1 ribosome small subunit-dependent GTPase A [Bacteroidota bacterium]MBP6638969.1 ribosome small subunit-dependent GTPase A [Bacteroidia bacterium]MBP8073187.1 ribosome small subunit-dependent GTPase A [Bacteroidia bacterium]